MKLLAFVSLLLLSPLVLHADTSATPPPVTTQVTKPPLVTPPPVAPQPAQIAQSLLESEALYTVTRGLKPISDGFWQYRFPDGPTLPEELQRIRTILKELPLGPDLEADVHVFDSVIQNQRSATAFILHRRSFQKLVERRADVFQPIGIDARTPAIEIMKKIDLAPRATRWKAFGLAFGYPDYAVDFFVHSGESQAKDGKFVERDFIQLPTVASDRGRFVYAVPKGHQQRAEDIQLRYETQQIFNRFQAWRQVYKQDSDFIPLLEMWVRWHHQSQPVTMTAPKNPGPSRCCCLPWMRHGSFSTGNP